LSSRIRWQSEADEGAFPLRARTLYLVYADGVFDLTGQVGVGQDGVAVEPPDAEGKLELRALGELSFEANGKTFPRVRLPFGGTVKFRIDDETGSLHAEGTAPVSDPLVGSSLGGYKLLGRLGAGGVGVVYRALQVNLDREVALKVLDEKVAERPEAVTSFQREAKAAGGLTHPHVVQVYDVGQADGRYYYTMELVPGGDLEDRLRDGGPMPWEDAVSALRDCARALAYADEHGLVHHDVKPENLMVAQGGVVKLADLGLAATRGILDSEATGGTPHFMAPESLGSGKVDHRSDLYSLGCTLYRLITGETVFSGDSVKAILLAHRDEQAPSLREAGIDAPKELDEVLDGLLAKDPDDRYAHASEVIAEFDALLEPRASKRWMLVALPVLAIAGVAATQMGGGDDEKEPETVIEYVEREGGADEAEVARLKAETEYFKAKSEPLADGKRASALRSYLSDYPDSPFVSDAEAELQRALDWELAQAEGEADPTVSAESEAERKIRQAREAEMDRVRTALTKGQFGEARALVRASQYAAHDAMLALALLVDEQAETRIQEWEKQHEQVLLAGDWSTADQLRTEMRLGLGESHSPWVDRCAALDDLAAQARLDAYEANFRADRENFLASVATVRPLLAQLEISAASSAWADACDAAAHPGLSELGSAWQATFVAAEEYRAAMQARVATEGLEIEEPLEQRKSDVLSIGPEGVKIRVQISGERQERTDAWELHRASPAAWRALLESLGPASEQPAELAALYFLTASEQLVGNLEQLVGAPNAQTATVVLGEVRAWEAAQPHAELLSEGSLQAWHLIAELCLALIAEDDLLALGHLEDLQQTFHPVSVWASAGAANWGLQALKE